MLGWNMEESGVEVGVGLESDVLKMDWECLRIPSEKGGCKEGLFVFFFSRLHGYNSRKAPSC